MYAHAEDLYQNSIMLCTTQRPQAELRSQQNTGYNDIRLPRIVIPSFSGGYTSWRSYRDLFTAMVHDNQQL